MTLTKYKLGELIEECTAKNEKLQYGTDDVKGISTGKTFIETKANMEGVSLTSYKIVKKNEFVYVADTSRRGDKIALALNNTFNEILISSIYTVFRIKRENLLLSDYLFMYFNRTQFDRYSRYNSWGSVRELFSWEEMCDIEIDLPPLSIQQKYVNVYKSMVTNQQSYEHGLEDLKLVCDAYIDKLRKTIPNSKLGDYISISNDINDKLTYGIDDVIGISNEKKFINTKADMVGVSLKPYAVVKPNEFAYVSVTSRNGGKISLAHNNSEKTFICSSSYIVFKVNNPNVLMPEYLAMIFNRSEFDRYSRFNSWGSARETFDWSEMCDVKIPIPSIEIQQDIVNIFKAYNTRKSINEKLKKQIKDICPILVKGSIEEAKRTEN